MAGIYIHIPFCKRRCHYCDFYSCTSLDKMSDLIQAVKTELASQHDYFGKDHLRTIYFGGGTPSVLNPAAIQSVIEHIKELWDSSRVGEITLEANPDDLSEAFLESLQKTDINRLSIGVQSFIDRDLTAMNRRHTASSAIEAVRNAQKYGFRNITIDLIYGLPGMSEAEWESNIRQALQLNVQHISAYHLTIESGTEFGRLSSLGRLEPVDEDQSEGQYKILHDLLTGAGFEHYEISNFAKPGYRAMHNSSYWSGEKYLGVGPSAHSYDGRRRRAVVADLDKYIRDVGRDSIYTTETLSTQDKYNEYIMVSLRRAEGVDICEMQRLFGGELADMFKVALKKFIDRDLVLQENNRYFIAPESFLVSDAIISELFWTD